MPAAPATPCCAGRGRRRARPAQQGHGRSRERRRAGCTDDPVRLYNLAGLLAAGRAYSRIYQGRGELIDHILVSRDLRLRLASIDSLVDDIGSITASTEARRAATVPDHAPVVARFNQL